MGWTNAKSHKSVKVHVLYLFQIYIIARPYIAFHKCDLNMKMLSRSSSGSQQFFTSETSIGTAIFRLGSLPHKCRCICHWTYINKIILMSVKVTILLGFFDGIQRNFTLKRHLVYSPLELPLLNLTPEIQVYFMWKIGQCDFIDQRQLSDIANRTAIRLWVNNLLRWMLPVWWYLPCLWYFIIFTSVSLSRSRESHPFQYLKIH